MIQAGTKNSGRWAMAVAMAALLAAAPAQADYPGAMWSVDQLTIAGATDAQAAQIRKGLTRANNTYFYGEHPVKMSVDVTGDGRMVVTLTDRASGKLLSRTGPIGLDEDVTGRALAWMDKLECTSADCTGGGSGTALAAVYVPNVPVGSTPTQEAVEIARVAKLPAGIRATGEVPMPKPRPGIGLAGLDLEGLAQVRIAKVPDPKLLEGAYPVRIARFSVAGLSNISYAASDALVVATPGAATAAAVPRRTAAERTLFGRLVFGLARFLGISGSNQTEQTQLAAAPATQPQQAVTPAAQASAPSAATPSFRPSERWRLTQQPTSTPAQGERVAALGTVAPATTAQALPQPQANTEFTGLRLVPSPGLRPPAPREEQSGPVVAPIRVTSVRAAETRALQNKANLSVKLSPELFNKYTPSALKHLFGSYGNQNAKVALVADEPGAGGSVDRVLAARGLALDSNRYARAERVYWGGTSGSRGFWIAMPRVAPSAFVLVASAKASVIANVHPSGNGVRVSDAVAEALGMREGSWSDVQIVALKQLDRTARSNRSGSALQ